VLCLSLSSAYQLVRFYFSDIVDLAIAVILRLDVTLKDILFSFFNSFFLNLKTILMSQLALNQTTVPHAVTVKGRAVQEAGNVPLPVLSKDGLEEM